MQLLVFAHTPPPLHGQSLMVQTLVEGLPHVAPEIQLYHVNPRLSRNAADIGRWRPGKFFALLAACFRALWLRARHGDMTFYYIPAPAKRSALYRDFLVMLLCRPCFGKLVLHWHAVGLGAWLATHATSPERWLARRLLGRADLSISLAAALLPDAQLLRPHRIALVPNGLTQNPAPKTQNPTLQLQTPNSELQTPSLRTQKPKSRTEKENPGATEVLFLGLCSRDKGLFDLLTAVMLANERAPGSFHLTVAGPFATTAEEEAFHSQVAVIGRELVSYIGFVDTTKKSELFASADLFCFPTAYPHEGQPLVLIEALAHDLPIVATRWRAVPSMLPSEHVWLVEPHRPDHLATALLAARTAPSPDGKLREHYLAHFTRERHLHALALALGSVTAPASLPPPQPS